MEDRKTWFGESFQYPRIPELQRQTRPGLNRSGSSLSLSQHHSFMITDFVSR